MPHTDDLYGSLPNRYPDILSDTESDPALTRLIHDLDAYMAVPVPADRQQRIGRVVLAGAAKSTQPRQLHTKEVPHRIGIWTGTIAAMLVVALLAATLLTRMHGAADQTNTGHGPAAQTMSGQWHTVDTMAFTSTATGVTPYPAFSPVNPSTVYEMTLGPASLRRSDDGGATWQALTLPIPAGKVVALQTFPSPLDAHTVFLTVSVNCPATVGAVGKTHGGILADPTAGAGGACSTTYRSTDDGRTWKTPSLPLASIVSELPLLGGPTAEAVLQAQGSHLYALLSCGQYMFQCSGFTGYTARLAASSDGGATWSLVDDGLGQGICDFAAQSDGQAVFVVAKASMDCDVDASASPSQKALYRSDNGGQSWQSVGLLPPGLAAQGMAAVTVGGKVMLYVNAPNTARPVKAPLGTSADQFLVSSDGGRSFKPTPLHGVPSGALAVNSRLIVRPDGSLVAAFSSTGDGLNASIYSWKPGASSWKLIAPAIDGKLTRLLRTVSASGAETLWAVSATDQTPTRQTPDHLFKFMVARFQP